MLAAVDCGKFRYSDTILDSKFCGPQDENRTGERRDPVLTKKHRKRHGENVESEKRRNPRLRRRLAELHFVKLSTEDGVVAGANMTRFGAPGVGTAIQRLSAAWSAGRIRHERIFAELSAATRRTGAWWLALGAIENALLDAKASCSACPATNCSAARSATGPGLLVALRHLAHQPSSCTSRHHRPRRVKAIGREVREKKFTALKTNIFTYTDAKPQAGGPASARRSSRRSTSTASAARPAHASGSHPRRRRTRRRYFARLNFNAKTEGYLKIYAPSPTSTCSGRDRQL